MANGDHEAVHIREAEEEDATAIAGLFFSVYESGYLYRDFYDERGIKRMIFDEDTLVLVAEDAESETIIGSASVLFQQGAHSDLVGEFGRLVVHPDWRGKGIGNRLMDERLARVGGRLHVAFVEVRVCSSHSARISQGHGFMPVGALPQKLRFGTRREHAGFLVRYFGDCLGLRKNHPRIIPEAQHLAEVALTGAGLEPDVIVDDDSGPYPGGADLELEGLTQEGYSSLLRIERGRLRNREVFGPQRLHYGLFKLAATHSNYLIARRGARIAGALGYTLDPVERHVRVFEVIHTEEDAIRFLFHALEQRQATDDLAAVEIDVSAHAPRMQRTLLEMGYLPCAYVPAMAFHEVERVDVVKMYRLFGDLQNLPFDAPEPTLSIGRYVLSQFATRQVMPRLARAMDRLQICQGLTEEQSRRLLGEFRVRSYRAQERIFEQGASAEELVLILDGHASVIVDGRPIGEVGPGESLGEVAVLNDTDHSMSAAADVPMEVGILMRDSLGALVRRRPDIGTVVYRNLARGLGQKLGRADRAQTET